MDTLRTNRGGTLYAHTLKPVEIIFLLNYFLIYTLIFTELIIMANILV